MRIIAKIVDMIDDELEGAEEYADFAYEQKPHHPRLADKLIELAEVEMGHAKILHGEVTRLIEETRQKDGEPPASMMAVYEYEHNKQIKRAAMIRQMIADYKNG